MIWHKELHSAGTLKIISEYSKIEKVSDEILEKYVNLEADKKAEERAKEEAAKQLISQLKETYKTFDMDFPDNQQKNSENKN